MDVMFACVMCAMWSGVWRCVRVTCYVLRVACPRGSVVHELLPYHHVHVLNVDWWNTFVDDDVHNNLWKTQVHCM